MPVEKLEFDMVKKNIEMVRTRRYIASGTVISLTTFFHVTKGDSNIQLVYDLTACGMNESLWHPKLFIPSVEIVLDTANHSSWFGYVDTLK